MLVNQSRNGLCLHDDVSEANKIGKIPLGEKFPLVIHLELLFAFEGDATAAELNAKRQLVNVLA